jgi:signal peptidase I
MNLRRWLVLGLILLMATGCDRFSSGDRVLVAKGQFENEFAGPHRFNVVVFKFPERPVEDNTPKNYIKRLWGLPGELLAIFFGRIFLRTPQPNEPPFFDDANRVEDGQKIDPNTLWRKPYMHIDDGKARQAFENGEFTILRKPPSIMLALRRIVYDNDFQAEDLKGRLDRWNPSQKSNWKADKGTGFVHEGSTDKVDWLRYQHLHVIRPIEPVPGAKRSLITDSMDYNNLYHVPADQVGAGGAFNALKPNSPHWVGDLMLECNVEVAEPKGEFWFELSKGPFRYRAKWDLASGQCTLLREGADGKVEELGAQPTGVKGPGSYMLRLANVDARLTVWVDRQLPFGDGVEYDPPEVRGKNDKGDAETIKKLVEARRGPTENDLEPASIGSKGANVKVSHVRLWRDTYYTTRAGDSDYDDNVARSDWSSPTRFEVLRKPRYTTLFVQSGHYLCLGDNSQASSDGREWGVVPERLLLGRALVVYFPFDRMGPIR